MTIRAATMDDIDEVYLITKEFQRNSPYADQDISDEKFYKFLTYYLTPMPKAHMVLVYEHEETGKIEGIIAGMITIGSHFFSENRVATEMVWYVRPEHRKGTAAIRLLHAYEDWAELMGCQKVSLTCVANEFREMLTKMYIKMGYKSTEETFVREI